VPLESVLHAYRLGGRVLWDALQRVFPPAQHQELLDVAGAVWSILDEQSVAMTVAYRDEEHRLLAHTRDAEVRAMSALLDGAARDPEIAVGLARTLGLTAGERLVVAVVDNSSTQRWVQDACRELAVSGTWLARRGANIGLLSLGRRTSVSLRDALGARSRGRVALSSDFFHLGDFTHAVTIAELAHAATVGEEKAVVLLEDRLVPALIAAAPEVSTRLVRRFAQPLLDLGQEGMDLIETVEAVLACDGSHAKAASQMFVHRNTIAHRLGRLERLCGIGLRHHNDRVVWTLTLLAMGRPAAMRLSRS
jgi:hypothetical protein